MSIIVFVYLYAVVIQSRRRKQNCNESRQPLKIKAQNIFELNHPYLQIN